MKQVRSKHFWPLAAAVALLVPGLLPALAGEPIQFSREKLRPAVAPEATGRPDDSRLSKEAARQTKGHVPSNPLEFMQAPGPDVRPRDPRDERRRKSADNERKNWMFYDRGESRDRDEDDLGLRDYSIEKDDGVTDSIFAPKANDARNSGRPRVPSALRRPSGQDPEEAPPAPETAKEPKRPDTDQTARDRSTGDHLSKDLDLSTLLSGGKSSLTDAPEQGDAASRTTRAGDLSARPRDDQERRRSDNNVNVTGAGFDTKSPGLGDLTGAGDNFGGPRATPSSFAPVAPRPTERNSSLDRNMGGALNSSRSTLDAGSSRSFNNPV